MNLHLSKCQIVGNLMYWLKFDILMAGTLTSVVSSDPSSYIWIISCRVSFKSGNSVTRCPTEQ